MSITTFAELQTAIGTWSARSDSAFTASIPDFIALAEARFNRELRTRWQETALTSETITSYQLAIPSDAAAVKHIWPDGTPTGRIEQKTLDYVVGLRAGGDGTPRFFAWSGANWEFDSSGTISGVYYAKVPALSVSATSNWILASHPDLYVWGALEQAAIFMKDAPMGQIYAAKTAELITRLNSISQADQVSGGKLVARAK